MPRWTREDHKKYLENSFREAALTIINDFLVATKPGKKQITIEDARARAKWFLEQNKDYYQEITS